MDSLIERLVSVIIYFMRQILIFEPVIHNICANACIHTMFVNIDLIYFGLKKGRKFGNYEFPELVFTGIR